MSTHLIRLVIFAIMGGVLCLPPHAQDGRGTGVPAGASAPHAVGKRHAILIGINEFKHMPEAKLQYAVADVEAIEAVLKQFYGFKKENITKLINDKATREAILREFDKLVDSKRFGPDDQVFIFIATHGATVKAGQRELGYIVPHDGKVNLRDPENVGDFATTCILMDDLLTRLDNAAARSVLLMVDICMGGMLIRSLEPTASQPDLAVLMLKPARQIIAAGLKDQIAQEDPKCGGGVFTCKVVEHLKAWAQAKPGVPLPASKLWVEVRDGVSGLSRGRQTPHYGYRPGYDGEFVFVPVGTPTPRRFTVSNPTLLRQTLTQASDGDVIVLEPGEYRLTEPIEITAGVQILGAGIEKTRVLLQSGDAALRFTGPGRFYLQDIAFEYTGAERPDLALVDIAAGEAQIVQCAFKGAKGKDDTRLASGVKVQGQVNAVFQNCLISDNTIGICASNRSRARMNVQGCQFIRNEWGIVASGDSAITSSNSNYEDNTTVGIGLTGSAQGEIRNNKFVSNGYGLASEFSSRMVAENNQVIASKTCGIVAHNQAQIVATNNLIQQSGGCGMYVAGEARLIASRNICQDNSGAGIVLCASARGELRENQCRRNHIGIRLCDQAYGVLTKNHCAENEHSGIWAGGTSHLIATENICVSNKVSGIRVEESAQGDLTQNICRHNDWHGISAGGQAKLKATENICENTKRTGIALLASAQGEVVKNTCRHNGLHGISAEGQAQLKATENTCEHNEQVGIAVLGTAQGEVVKNTCRQNGYHGISAAGQAKLIATENICENNSASGVALFESAQGEVVKNLCRHNRYYGIEARGQVRLTASENTCESNKEAGIVLLDSVKGELVKNFCRYNDNTGIEADGNTSLTAVENTCDDNRLAGIALHGTAQGKIAKNLCRRNGIGIVAVGRALLTATENTCENNEVAGIALVESAQGELVKNICRHNGYDGIAAEGQAKINATENTCENNQRAGIALLESAQGEVRDNICLRNQRYGIAVDGQATPTIGRNRLEGNGVNLYDWRRQR